MPDPFRLPRIKTLDRIVDALGRPTVQFIKFFNVDFAGAIERQEAAQAVTDAAIIAVNERQDATDADLQAQIDRLTAILAGTGEAFTGLNVGGTNVKTFLDKTDGAKLTDATGLDGSVVVTATLDGGAANQVITASGSSVALPAATPTTVLSIVVTTIAGEVVDLSAQFGHLEISDPAIKPQIVGFWKRGATVIPASAAVSTGIDVTRAADAARYVLAGGGITVVGTDIPGAGTHTYDLSVEALVAAAAQNPAARLLTSTRP